MLITKSMLRGLDKNKLEGYYECHRIVPKCLGGGSNKSNLVLLTARTLKYTLPVYDMDTLDLKHRGLKYAGCFTLCRSKAKRYASVKLLSPSSTELSWSKAFAYCDSESTAKALLLELVKCYSTVRAVQLSPVNWLVAWSDEQPKGKRLEQVLIKDLEGCEYVTDVYGRFTCTAKVQ